VSGPRILVTGAAGSVGSALVAGLPSAGWSVVALDLASARAEGAEGVQVVVGNAFSDEVLDVVLPGCAGVVHLAAIPGEAPVEDIVASHVVGTACVLRAAQRHGVERAVLASSNHAVGFTPRSELAGVDVRPRPDSFYGVGKVATEALGSMYSDRYGMRVAALRIGTFADRPVSRRHLSTWLSPGDLVRLVDAMLLAPDLTYAAVYGISANTRRWWDLRPGQALGYQPLDDAEAYADEVLASTPEQAADDPDVAYLGGWMATRDVRSGAGAPAAPTAPAASAAQPQADAAPVATGGGDLFSRARAWAAEDPDGDTRNELEALLVADEIEELADRFDGKLEFGTAGLRGRLGAGPNRMNRAVVIRAAAGLCAYQLEHDGGAVVVGYDARHKSDVFARDTARVASGFGLPAMVLPRPAPTPVLAYAIRHLGAAAGVMVTASHNPPQDNGYKVYLGSGSQIVPPVDEEISAKIDAVGSLASVPVADEWVVLGDDVAEHYIERTADLVDPAELRDLRVVYTPMHGVGRDVVLAVFERGGFPPLMVVPRQGDPDPDFPTVAFPNPEEPGAMDLAMAAARESAADLIIANDPDADRCAVGVPTPDGDYRMLRGDDVGVLLGLHMLRRGARGTFANSIVSSSMLGKIAADAGVGFAETLTGFKWIARIPDLSYGYEEALGYCVDPDAVRDKDGVSAALLIAEMASQAKAQGRTLADELDDLARRFGVHATDQLSVRVADLAQIAAVMDRLRAQPPQALGGRTVTSLEDLSEGIDGLPPTDGLRYRLEGGARVIVRPSGTEAKLKCYLEVVVPVASSLAGAREAAAVRLGALKSDLAAAAGL
jgi:phosphomannomutase